MLPEGKLYVPGADETLEAMARLVAAARSAGLVHVAPADDHELTDAEISERPDYETTYPPHCLRGTRGARKVPETEQIDPVTLVEDAARGLDADRTAACLADWRAQGAVFTSVAEVLARL